MSSRKSSSSRTSNNNENTDTSIELGNLAQQFLIIGFVFSVVVQCSILYYLYNLEDADCNCIRDWRHNFCKAFALIVLGTGILLIAFLRLPKGYNILYYGASLINAYAFFTYVGDLNATQCVCAVKKQANLNTVMRIYRWILLIAGIGTTMQLLTLLWLSSSK